MATIIVIVSIIAVTLWWVKRDAWFSRKPKAVVITAAPSSTPTTPPAAAHDTQTHTAAPASGHNGHGKKERNILGGCLMLVGMWMLVGLGVLAVGAGIFLWKLPEINNKPLPTSQMNQPPVYVPPPPPPEPEDVNVRLGNKGCADHVWLEGNWDSTPEPLDQHVWFYRSSQPNGKPVFKRGVGLPNNSMLSPDYYRLCRAPGSTATSIKFEW